MMTSASASSILRRLLPPLLSLLLLLPSLCSASINLLITQAEMNRTLGVSAEMSYIEDGVVNGYSTGFPYRVMADISELKFTWNAPSTAQIHYSMTLSSDAQVVAKLLHPSSGFLPRTPSQFSIEYRCVAAHSGQFEVALLIEFTSSEGGNSTRVRLRQEKMCTARTRGEIYREVEEMKSSSDDSSAQSVFYFIIIAAALFLSLIFFLLYLYFRGSKKDERRNELPSTSSRFGSSFRSSFQSRQPFLTSTPAKPKSSLSSSLRPVPLPPSSSLVEEKPVEVNVKKYLIDLHADRNLFQLLFVDMEGSYGETRWAIWRQNASGESGDVDDEEDEGTGDEAMIVKALKTTANAAQVERFFLEVFAFQSLPPHPHLAQVAAAASFGRFDKAEAVTDLPLICYRHRGFGNLRKFLLSCRSSNDEKRPKSSAASSTSGASGGHTLRTHELVSISVQITRAVAHLHRYGILHKDIAARNCIVSENAGAKHVSERLLVQLMDSALSRDLHPSDYSQCGEESLPLKWMALETLATRTYSSASDIWSLGVLIWELLSCGAPPFSDLPPDQLLGRLQAGERLPQPYNCPDQLYEIVLSCWRPNAHDRPNAVQLLTKLVEFNVTLNKYI